LVFSSVDWSVKMEICWRSAAIRERVGESGAWVSSGNGSRTGSGGRTVFNEVVV
jgi:hypothetical protein